MKNYFNRVFAGCKKWELVYWWIFRALMIFGIFLPLFADKVTFIKISEEIPMSANMLQMGANTVGMFGWEILMMFPEKTFVRHLPSYVQNISVPFIFLTAFGGAYLNFYYSIWWWDSVLHVIGAVLGVLGGYEIVCCMQKRDKEYLNLPVALLCSFCFCFFMGIMWELFEFTYDQVAGGDSQHWNIALAQVGYRTLFPELNPSRFALMDTMGDIVCNTVGALIGYIILKICPYHHRGKNDLNKIYSKAVSSHKQEKVKSR